MLKRNTLLFCITIISSLMLNFRCGRDRVERVFDQTFEIPVTISPLKKSYALTDTIWVETEVSGKLLYETKTNQVILVDTGALNFGVTYYGFGLNRKAPEGGFCDVITLNGVNTNRTLTEWTNHGHIENFGCTSTSYRVRMGFNPNHTGTYSLILPQEFFLNSCSNKVVPYKAATYYKFAAADLNLDVFNNFADLENLPKSKKTYFIDKVNNREMFVFRVE
jgi:hypothetical protein